MITFQVGLEVSKGVGGIVICSYIHRLGSFFWFQNFEFQYFWGFLKNKYFLGYEAFVDIFLGDITKLDYI